MPATTAMASRGARGRASRTSSAGPSRAPGRRAVCPSEFGQRVRGDEHRDVEPAGPQRDPAARVDQRQRGDADEQHGPERGRHEVVRAALGEEQRHREPARHRRRAEGRRGGPVGPAPRRLPARAARRRARRRPPRRGRRRTRGSPRRTAARAPPAPHSDRRAHTQARDGERDPERERHPPDDHVAHHARRGRARPRARRTAGVAARRWARRAKSHDRGHGRRHADEARAGHGGQRRVEQRVAGHVVAAVPLRVPGGEADLVPEPRPVACARPCRPCPGRRAGTRRRAPPPPASGTSGWVRSRRATIVHGSAVRGRAARPPGSRRAAGPARAQRDGEVGREERGAGVRLRSPRRPPTPIRAERGVEDDRPVRAGEAIHRRTTVPASPRRPCTAATVSPARRAGKWRRTRSNISVPSLERWVRKPAPGHVGRVEAGDVAQAAAREQPRQLMAHAHRVDQPDHLAARARWRAPGRRPAGGEAGGEGHQHEQRSAQRQE